MGSPTQSDSNDADGEAPVETDPSNRFQRLNEILGEGAYKHVYRAFDQEEGVEVAWNQLRIDHLTKKEAQKILSEIEILQSIRNDHIINFYSSWSTKAPNGGERIVFVTELMSSGTLKQYLKKTLKGALKPKVLKSWCRQILQGLVYLHTHDPPIIHRDLKCDNIFINGNNGQLKIGDLGLAVVRHRTHVSSVLGTPEFMAPELYDEKYDEKVDIYAFGMCVLEMVTKEYPYSECTNQAQIYRKVTKGIKPQSLDVVKDPETWEFINRCLDHDDRTRPSAQELLDSDFLKPCAAVPPIPTPAANLYIHLGRSVSEGIEMTDSPMSATVGNSSDRSSFAEPHPHPPPHPSLATSPTSALFTPMPAVLPKALPSPIKVVTQPIVIPSAAAAFTTTTTVDADNKTYHIRSNLLPQTPTSAEQSSAGLTQDMEANAQDSTPNQSQNEQEDLNVEPPTLHSHANSRTCNIQVVQYGEASGDQLNLKMICTCPVAGPRDVNLAAGTHEIKFPFDLSIDTVEDVVAEMIREQILSGDDREEATSKIQELIDGVILSNSERNRQLKEQSRSSKVVIPHHGHGHGHGRSSAGHSHRSASNNYKNGHNRQLNVPSVYDMDQYGTSPTESLYDHYSSVGSNGSGGWNDNDSPVESDQGYGTVPPQPVQQPPIVTEATFPPLQLGQPPRGRPTDAQHPDEMTEKHHQATYSEAVQHPVVGQHPLSPPLPNRDLSPAASSRPQAVHVQDKTTTTQPAPEPATLQVNGVSGRATLRDIETAAAIAKKEDDGAEDVGYTSPYRHGVSSSSVNYHRRSPSADTATLITAVASSSAALHTGPSEPLMSASGPFQDGDQHRPSISSTISTSNSPEIRPISARSSIASTLNGNSSQSSTASRPAALIPVTGAPRPALAPLSIPGSASHQEPHRMPHSTNEREHHPQHSHQHAFASLPKPQQQQPLLESMLMSHTLKDADSMSGSSRMQGLDRMNVAYTNGSNYSSCPEMSDDDEILDEDLKILREQQRQELELMRLQHVQQWEKMMKLKEQKGLQERTRHKSDISATPRSPSFASTPAQ